MKLKAIQEMLRTRLAKRGVNLKSVTFEAESKAGGDMIRQLVKVKQGLTTEELKRITKHIKDTKMKVTPSIQSDHLRVTGKKRDDLQEAIQHLRSGIPDLDLQFTNFRD